MCITLCFCLQVGIPTSNLIETLFNIQTLGCISDLDILFYVQIIPDWALLGLLIDVTLVIVFLLRCE